MFVHSKRMRRLFVLLFFALFIIFNTSPSLSFADEYEDIKAASIEDALDAPNPIPGSGGISLMSMLRSFGPTWVSRDNGDKAFIDGNGVTYLADGWKVVDVSEWNKTVDWAMVKASGVDAAIIRLGYGSDAEDLEFERNVSECKRLGIPFGIYLYSYAYDAISAFNEAKWVDAVLTHYGYKNSLSLPIFYDLEAWTWTGHTRPAAPAAYEKIIDSFYNCLQSKGYSNIYIYTYRTYMQNELNSSSIWSKIAWIAEYGSTLNVKNSHFSGNYGWQYTSSASVPGIAGNADLSAFVPYNNWKVTANSSVPWVGKGDSVTIRPTILNDDIGNYQFNYVWSLNGSWAQGDWNSTVNETGSYTKSQSWTFSPAKAGTYTIYVTAKDPNGIMKETRLTVEALSFTPSVSVSRSSSSSAYEIRASVAGAPSGLRLKYVWEKDGWSSWGILKDKTSVSTLAWAPGNEGQYAIYVDYIEPSGAVHSISVAVDVRSSWSLSLPLPASAALGSVVPIAPDVSGASSADLSYNYVWSREGSWAPGEWGSTVLSTGSWTRDASWSFRPARAGRYRLYASVRDAAGIVREKSSWVDVTTN